METPKPTRSSLRIPYLDLARFLAAIYVALYHFCFDHKDFTGFTYEITHSQYGYLGVKFFFILSGFVIFQSATREGTKEFALKRLIRLYPMLLICATISFVVSLYTLVPDPRSVGDFFANVTLFEFLTPYYNYIDPAYWTLREEILFYSIVGLLILSRRINSPEKWIPILFGCSMLSHLLHDFASRESASADNVIANATTYLPTHLPLFLIGCIFFLLYRDRALTWLLRATLAACSIWVLFEAFREGQNKLFDIGGSPIIAVLITAASIGFFAFIALSNHAKMRQPSKLEEALGRASYPLYLIHQEVGLVILVALVPLIGRWPALILVLVLLTGFTYFLSTFLEIPIQKKLRAILTPRKVSPTV